MAAAGSMMFHNVRVAPDPKYIAEVVLLLTTLGAKRTEFNAGKRASDLLQIKRVHHKVIDFNRDARQAGTGEAENLAIQKLMTQSKLQTGDNDDLILPQIFIDGVFIGDATDLQGLEDDGMLNGLLHRTACMKCHDRRRQPSASQCANCWSKFEEILPGKMTIEQALEEIRHLSEDYDDDDDYDDQDGTPAMASQLSATAAAASSRAAGYPAAVARASTATAAPAAAPAAPLAAASPQSVLEPLLVSNAKAPAPALAGAEYRVGEQVQYWSDSKNRWIDALVDDVREKDGRIVYDLNCKKGAALDKLKRPGAD